MHLQVPLTLFRPLSLTARPHASCLYFDAHRPTARSWSLSWLGSLLCRPAMGISIFVEARFTQRALLLCPQEEEEAAPRKVPRAHAQAKRIHHRVRCYDLSIPSDPCVNCPHLHTLPPPAPAFSRRHCLRICSNWLAHWCMLKVDAGRMLICAPYERRLSNQRLGCRALCSTTGGVHRRRWWQSTRWPAPPTPACP